MYDIVVDIIGHVWDTGSLGTAEQELIYSICGVIIIIVLVLLGRWIDRIFMR